MAIAITANFKNKRTTAEAVVEEISGVAFVYKQDFFNNLYEELGIALENIVYYKDETHYFVMTTKKHSLLDRKVLKKVSRIMIHIICNSHILSQETVYILRRKKNVLWLDICTFLRNYKDETHYFVMSTKKHSLLDRKVLKKVSTPYVDCRRI